MQRIDLTDPKAANAQILDDLNNGATGVALVFQGAIGDYGYALPASGAAISATLDNILLDAGIAVDLDLGRPSKDAAGLLATLVKARGLSPRSVSVRFGFNPLGAIALTGESPRSWPDIRREFHVSGLRSCRPRFRRSVCRCRRARHSCRRRFGSAGARLRACLGDRVSPRAGARRYCAGGRATLHLFPLGRRSGSVPDHRQVPRLAEIVGAHRAGLRARASAKLRRRRDCLAHDDQARSARQHRARHHCHAWRCGRRRRCHHRAAVQRSLGLPDAFARRIARNTQTF